MHTNRKLKSDSVPHLWTPSSGLLLVIQPPKQLTPKWKWAPIMCQPAVACCAVSVEETGHPALSSFLCLGGKSLPLVPITLSFTTWLSRCCHPVTSWYHHKTLVGNSMGMFFINLLLLLFNSDASFLTRALEMLRAFLGSHSWHALTPCSQESSSLFNVHVFAMFSCLVP